MIPKSVWYSFVHRKRAIAHEAPRRKSLTPTPEPGISARIKSPKQGDKLTKAELHSASAALLKGREAPPEWGS